MRKVIYIVLIVFIGISVWQTYLIYRPVQDTPLDIADSVNLSEIDDLPECTLSDTLSYYYYQNSPWDKNNKFGLYIYAEDRSYFELAQNLVNSRGGDWGYVLIPYNVKDYDSDKWERVFEQLRNKHLIPVIQLWDVDLADYEQQTEKAAEFLDSFVWPIKPRYISVYNEVNDNNFWYGEHDPAIYAKILDFTIDIFKSENENFTMMNGAFNISAPTNSQYTDAFEFMTRMDQEVPGIFNKLDAWASHPYPQPNFSGSAHAYGRWSIRAYQEELAFLKKLGVEKDLPVFITETGWAHAEGASYNPSYLSVSDIAENFEIAYKEVWLKDDAVQAVMPFTISYESPFDHFSWVNADKVPYKHYDVVKLIQKVKGNPPALAVSEVDLCSQTN